MAMTSKQKFVVFVGIALVVLGLTCIVLPKFVNANIYEETITVLDKQYVSELTSETTSNGNTTHTENYYLITTKGKTYRVDLKGVFAQPHIASQLQENHTYEVKVFLKQAIPALGIYPIIVEIINEK